MSIAQRHGDPVVFAQDEGVRADITAASLAALRTSSRTGTITAGNASSINDGAAAVVVMSKAKAIELGLDWLAESVRTVASPPSNSPSEIWGANWNPAVGRLCPCHSSRADSPPSFA